MTLRAPSNSIMADAQNIEAEIMRAMRARTKYFKDQADSLTLEGVRRMLEKDMGLKAFALDVHKRFIKQGLNECFESLNDENASKSSRENSQQTTHSEKEEKDPCEEIQLKRNGTGLSSEDENLEEPQFSVKKETTEHETGKTEGSKSETLPSEDIIKKAIKKRASYIRAKSENITSSGVRRLLEEDLKLKKNALDSYKSFINDQINMILECPEDKSEKEIKKKNGKKVSRGSGKGSKKVSQKDDIADTSGSDKSAGEDGGSTEDEEVDEEETIPKKSTARKRKAETTEVSKQRKRSKDTKSASNGKSKPLDSAKEKSSESDDGGDVSENGSSRSSAEENVKKKRESATNSYGKQVEHLKSVIKSCGMSVPPSVYKKAKQGPDSKREAFLITELQEILKKEGLSTNSSEKDIKEVKKRKERAKELEGIDMSNIVSSTRRRSTSNFLILPKPKVPDESDEDADEEEESDDEEDEGDSEDASDDFKEDADDESE